MNKGKALTLLLFLFFVNTFYSQKTTAILKTISESDYQLIGIWKNKVFSCKTFYDMELTIVDTTAERGGKQMIKVGPEVDKVKKIGSLYYFIHGDFLYEAYFVIPKIVAGEPLVGYNMLVKRDLETMKIVAQKRLNHLLSQEKFVKICERGFYFCFGTSRTTTNSLENIYYSTPPNKVLPRRIYGFDYDLKELGSINLENYGVARNSYMNDIAIDETSHVLIPFVSNNFRDKDGRSLKAKLSFVVMNLEGEVAKVLLDLDLDKYVVSSTRVKYDEKNKKFKGVLMVSKPDEQNNELMNEWGFIYCEWKEDGSLLQSTMRQIKKHEIFGPNIQEYAKRVDLNLDKVSLFRMDADVAYFDFLNDGSVLYVANNICLGTEEKLVHSKFLLCISEQGDLKWSLLLPYNGNQLYEDAFYLVKDDQLQIYTREFSQNFKSGTYVFKDTREGLNGSSLVMSERVINLKTGEIISHVPIIEEKSGKFVPFSEIYSFNANEYIFRYRDTQKNLEKFVVVEF